VKVCVLGVYTFLRAIRCRPPDFLTSYTYATNELHLKEKLMRNALIAIVQINQITCFLRQCCTMKALVVIHNHCCKEIQEWN